MGECVLFPSENVGDDAPLIPEGKYEMNFVGYKTWVFMGRQPKVVITFRVIGPGSYFGVLLPAYYNVLRTLGKRGRNGGFKAAKKSNLFRDFCRIFQSYIPKRLDRIPLSKLETVAVIGIVETVKKGFDQREIPASAQYSVVRRIEP